jgi:hypothetical protein
MLSHSPSGLKAAPFLEWGSHVAHFFRSGQELRDVLVPYFKAGLENNERCLWVTGAPLMAHEARTALREAVPDLDWRETRGQMRIAVGSDWYSPEAPVDPDALIQGLLELEEDALAQGYAGLRTNGNCCWVGRHQWDDFITYEALVQATVNNRRLICMCSYALDGIDDAAQAEVMEHHHLSLPARAA